MNSIFEARGRKQQANRSGRLTHLQTRRGFGLNEVIGIAAGIIIAVVVVIPGLQSFATSVLSQLTNWWNSMASGIFTG